MLPIVRLKQNTHTLKQKESRDLERQGEESVKLEKKSCEGGVARDFKREAGSEPFEIDFMDICRIDTPLVKRIPNSQRSAFATVWGQLLSKHLTTRSEAAGWSLMRFPSSSCAP